MAIVLLANVRFLGVANDTQSLRGGSLTSGWRLWGIRKIVHLCRTNNYCDLFARIALYVWVFLIHAIPGDCVACSLLECSFIFARFHGTCNYVHCAVTWLLARVFSQDVSTFSWKSDQMWQPHSIFKIPGLFVPHWRSQLTIRANMGSCNMKNI